MAEPISSGSTLRCAAPISRGSAGDGVALEPEPFLGVGKVQFIGKTSAAMFGAIFGRPPPPAGGRAAAGELTVSWLAPGEWLVTGRECDVCSMLERVDAEIGDMGLATDLTHARASYLLSGAHARHRLAALTPLDVSDRAMPVEAVARAPLGETGMFLARLPDDDEGPQFRIIVDQTMATYAARMLADPISASKARQ